MGTKCTVFASDKGDIKADLAFFNNYNATTAPGASNDTTQGYRRGSQWQNQSVSPVAIYVCTNDTAGAAVWELLDSASGAEGVIAAPAASTATGNGSNASLSGGAGGSTSGNGGTSSLVGGAGTAGNGNGGSAIIQGGAPNGTGVAGSVRELGLVMRAQGAAATLNATGTLTAANLTNGIISSTAAAAVAATLPLATALDTAIPDAVAGDSFDFSVINTSGTPADTFTIGTASGWTLVGSMVVTPVTTVGASGRFRAAKTAAGAWTLFRLS